MRGGAVGSQESWDLGRGIKRMEIEGIRELCCKLLRMEKRACCSIAVGGRPSLADILQGSIGGGMTGYILENSPRASRPEEGPTWQIHQLWLKALPRSGFLQPCFGPHPATSCGPGITTIKGEKDASGDADTSLISMGFVYRKY